MSTFRHKNKDGEAFRKLHIWQSGDEADLSSDSFKAATSITITTAQILALFATPITVIAAPGAGKFITIDSVTAWYEYNAAAYAGIAAGEDWAFKYTNASGAELTGQIETTGFLDQTADGIRRVGGLASVITPVANAVVVLHQLSAEIITGDSPVHLHINYTVHSANPVVPS